MVAKQRQRVMLRDETPRGLIEEKRKKRKERRIEREIKGEGVIGEQNELHQSETWKTKLSSRRKLHFKERKIDNSHIVYKIVLKIIKYLSFAFIRFLNLFTIGQTPDDENIQQTATIRVVLMKNAFSKILRMVARHIDNFSRMKPVWFLLYVIPFKIDI